MVAKSTIWICSHFKGKVPGSLCWREFKIRKVRMDLRCYRYPRSEEENVSLYHKFVHSSILLLHSWNQYLVFVLSLPNDGFGAFQVTHFLLSEWKYLNACCFSSFKLFSPMFLLLRSRAAICTRPLGWQKMRIMFGVEFIWWHHIPGSWACAELVLAILVGRHHCPYLLMYHLSIGFQSKLESVGVRSLLVRLTRAES